MQMDLFMKIATQVIGGLGIFLLGMKYMSEGLQAVAGGRLRKTIGMVTNNRVMGVLVGLFVTCLVQSSSVTTVMVVGLVNSGFMTLLQAIGVIFGANIGTTITGWILVLKIGKYGLPILGVAAFFFLFSKKERLRYTGMAVMGIGMVFFGLELMKNGFKPLRSHEEFEAWFHAFQAVGYLGILKCAAVGCILTMIVQSSSATLGITIGLAATGVIEFRTAAALVMGENIGTTITAMLAAIGTSTTSRRAAAAHVLFNVIGTTWFILAFPFVIKLMGGVVESLRGANPLLITLTDNPERYDQIITTGIATVHTSFNVVNTLVFLPFAGLLAKLVTQLIPDRKGKEIKHLTYLDVRMLESPALSIVQSQEQIAFMAESGQSMLDHLRFCLTHRDEAAGHEGKIFRREEILDNVQKEIFVFLSHLVAGEVPHEVTNQAHRQMRIADEYESLSDYIVNVLKGIKKLQQNNLQLTDEETEHLLNLHDRVTHYIEKVNRFAKEEEKPELPWAVTEGTAISELMKQFRREHLSRLQEEKVSPFLSLVYTDMLNHYRRMKDHALNIAEVVAGEK